MANPSYAQVSALLKYNPETGKLYWLPRPVEMFAVTGHGGAQAAAKTWNSMYANKEAFTFISRNGYKRGTLLRRPYEAHRIIWLMETAEWPSLLIDHIDGDKLNNRLDNLRLVSHSENGRNRRMNADNTSGVNGVYWNKATNKWKAHIGRQHRMYLGEFDRLEDAAAARQAANAKFGYSCRHGKPLPTKEQNNA